MTNGGVPLPSFTAPIPIAKIAQQHQSFKRSSWGTQQTSAVFLSSLPKGSTHQQQNHLGLCAVKGAEEQDDMEDIQSTALLAPAVETDFMEIDMDVAVTVPVAPVHVHARTSLITHFPPELLLQIFSHFDPPSRDSTAFLSPASTITALRHCASVCRWWNRVATRVLWRKPRVYDAVRFEKLVVVAEGASAQAPDAPSTSTFAYPELIQHLSLSQTLSEPHRYAHRLSPLLVRLINLPTLHLTTLDLGFCKGVSNFALQRCAHSLRTLTSLNLAGGGRSEICVIKLASECRGLKRLGLGWNSAVTDFCVREVGRWCRQLEWVDLSGCYGVGDMGVMWLAKGLVAQQQTLPSALDRLMDAGMVPSNGPRSAGAIASPSSSLPFASSLPSSAIHTRPSSPAPRPTRRSSSAGLLRTPPQPPRSTLRHINLSYCQNITSVAVRELVEKCRSSLQVINVIGCGDMASVRAACHRVPPTLVHVAVPRQPVVVAIPSSSSSSESEALPSVVQPSKLYHAVAQPQHLLDVGRFLTNRRSGKVINMDVPGFVPFWDGVC
ncbi:hypothetical protein HKX48_008341 [Thoreauomyces humboldtii]|nr:hypothetical protein HKX48_008341 [Thoreauomyces humboldtii]